MYIFVSYLCILGLQWKSNQKVWTELFINFSFEETFKEWGNLSLVFHIMEMLIQNLSVLHIEKDVLIICKSTEKNLKPRNCNISKQYAWVKVSSKLQLSLATK